MYEIITDTMRITAETILIRITFVTVDRNFRQAIQCLLIILSVYATG